VTRDPFAYDVIADDAAAFDHPSPEHTWRRLLLVRPKTIPLGETSTLTATTGSKTTSDVVIADQVAAKRANHQCRPPVQVRASRELTPGEQDVMELLASGETLSAAALAMELGCSARGLKRRELLDLQRDGFIESIPGYRGGYRARARRA
jgi:hypothetical protein